MTSRNDITGDEIATKNNSDAYRDGWDRIFGKKTEKAVVKEIPLPKVEEPAPAVNTKAEQEMEYRRQWWDFCQKNSKRLKVIPQFEDFMAGKIEFNDEG